MVRESGPKLVELYDGQDGTLSEVYDSQMYDGGVAKPVLPSHAVTEYDDNVAKDTVLPSQTNHGTSGGGGAVGQSVPEVAMYERDKCMKHGGLLRRVATKDKAWQLQRDGTISVRTKVRLGWSCDNVRAVQTHSTSLSDCVKKADNVGRK